MINIIAIPEYILKALNERGIHDSKLSESLDMDAVLYKREERLHYVEDGIYNRINHHLLKTIECLSQQDKLDIKLVNDVLYKEFNLPTDIYSDDIKIEENINALQDIFDILSDSNCNISRIVMSNIYNNVSIPWRFIKGESSVIIVLEKGFFNYKVESIPEFDVYFLSILSSYMFSLFSFERTIKQKYFKVFNSRVHKLVSR